MLTNSLIILQALVFFFIERSEQPIVTLEPTAIPRDYDSILPFIPRFSFAFEYQVYFMIVYPYLGDIKKSQRGMQLATATSSLMLLYCLVFSVLSMGSHHIVLNSYGIVELYYQHVPGGT